MFARINNRDGKIFEADVDALVAIRKWARTTVESRGHRITLDAETKVSAEGGGVDHLLENECSWFILRRLIFNHLMTIMVHDSEATTKRGTSKLGWLTFQ